ncbi:hypothetical protein Tco_0203885, partial [Tanacetum coccineum]
MIWLVKLCKKRKKKGELRKIKRLKIDIGRFPFAMMMTRTIPLQSYPSLPIKEPDNSLSMGDEHLDTVLATESDKVIKSSVEDFVPILSESEGIPDKMCDVPLFVNTTPDNSSSDDDSPYSKDIDYVDASPPDTEI